MASLATSFAGALGWEAMIDRGTAPTSPLDPVMRRCGAVMAEHQGRFLPAHFGSAQSEMAACLTSVGITDRSDRATLELTGQPAAVTAALAELARAGEPAWWATPEPSRALIRCERREVGRCAEALGRLPDVSALDVSAAYVSVGVVGPHADELLAAVELDPALIVREDHDCFEILVEADRGAELWNQLIDAGHPFHLACVGFEALEHLAASHRLNHH